ncbi:hypothetical protein ACFE04_025290 [Oxalis oulophora]
MAMSLKASCNHLRPVFTLTRLFHTSLLPPMGGSSPPPPPIVLPEYDQNISSSWSIGFNPFTGGSMELMAVPKRKTSPHKRGIRNGPKALKPHPVIIRCRTCGRVKLPHFFCCSGDRGKTEEQNS